ncbi:hypothetical protein MTBBW1_1760003 [Desulfamplus magnetovallimortis]|uniref:Uncharacterized protein n=1 Tax=Desulfamplus magnetovallimortis TaxID=1246637 RepID=A0A1W1HA32_9BACT|nr:hypothetical protein MTBBW1_1760003 [Desulfamplus magnetovallimortis]
MVLLLHLFQRAANGQKFEYSEIMIWAFNEYPDILPWKWIQFSIFGGGWLAAMTVYRENDYHFYG